MGLDYRSRRVSQLRELAWERGHVPRRWMVYFFKKKELVKLLEVGKPANEKVLAALRERQKVHMEKAITAKKNRAAAFGVTKLTQEEKVHRLILDNPGLSFHEVRAFPNGFESATGYRRGKYAIVLIDPSGREILLTKTEADVASKLGVKVPVVVRRQTYVPENSQAKKTMRDIFS